MDKLNITEGLWKLTDNFEITVDDVDPQEMSSEEIEANAKAIVTAVNSTYKQGVNPEAVPDIIEALEDCFDFINWCNGDGFTTEDWDKLHVVINKAEQALKKAEL